MNRIHVHDTHIYPGCLATFFFRMAPEHTTVSATAEFSDEAIAGATVEQVNAGEVIVHVDSYTTARGTAIPEKAWRLRYDESGNTWKVVEKLQHFL